METILKTYRTTRALLGNATTAHFRRRTIILVDDVQPANRLVRILAKRVTEAAYALENVRN
jgi:hypothetical protein